MFLPTDSYYLCSKRARKLAPPVVDSPRIGARARLREHPRLQLSWPERMFAAIGAFCSHSARIARSVASSTSERLARSSEASCCTWAGFSERPLSRSATRRRPTLATLLASA